MATKYYKKASPKQTVFVSGMPLKFDQINIELGVYKTDDENLQREMAAMFARGVGGMFEISADDYTKLVEKKTTNSQGSYRDEFGKSFTQVNKRPENDLVYHADQKVEQPVTSAREDAKPASEVKPNTRPLPRKRA